MIVNACPSPTSPLATPAGETLSSLIDLAESVGRQRYDAWLFALAWLAASRLAALKRLPGVGGVADLLSEEAWQHVGDAGLPASTEMYAWGLRDSRQQEQSLRTRAIALTTALLDRAGTEDWDVIDAPWYFHWDSTPLSPDLCELLTQLVDAPREASIWIPFDATGQLVLRAVRRGWSVTAVGPAPKRAPHLHFLLAIDASTEVARLPISTLDSGMAALKGREFDYVLCTPPLGGRGDSLKTSVWPRLSDQSSHEEFLHLDRTESWAMAFFSARTRKKAVFLVSPTVLFAKGQEERLREHLLGQKLPVSTVATLPPRLLSGSSLSLAVVMFDGDRSTKPVRLIDGSGYALRSKASDKASTGLDTPRLLDVLIGGRDDDAIEVTRDEIAKNQFNLVPARYAYQAALDLGPTVPLGELVEVVRAPVAEKDRGAITVQEAGFPELERWNAITPPTSKTAKIRPAKLAHYALKRGDIILSIKGTIGKCGLVGDVPNPTPRTTFKDEDAERLSPTAQPLVLAQSCVALRVTDRALALVSPVFLFLFFRSDQFRQQLDALRVGAVIAHVTPADVLQSVRVPQSDQALQAVLAAKYDELCGLERQADVCASSIEQLRRSLWTR